MRGGVFHRFRPGSSGASGANAAYITRGRATGWDREAILTRNYPEHAREADDYGELRENIAEHCRQAEKDEFARPRRGGGETQTHYRGVLSFEGKVETGQARDMADDYLERNFDDHLAIAAVHQDTEHTHVHLHVQARDTDGHKLHLSRQDYRHLDESWAEIYAQEFGRVKLEWFAREAREFPWRRSASPYVVLVAEFLLQQTTARQVAAVLPTFLARYPAPSVAADAPLSHLASILHPLGLRHRVADLHAALSEVATKHDDRVPSDERQLGRLRGVGPYISRAVRCFAFGHDVLPIDVNVHRVLDRVFGIVPTTTRGYRDRQLRMRMDAFVPNGCGRAYAWAILDLAAKVCTRKKPLCSICPVRAVCRYAREGEAVPALTIAV